MLEIHNQHIKTIVLNGHKILTSKSMHMQHVNTDTHTYTVQRFTQMKGQTSNQSPV